MQRFSLFCILCTASARALYSAFENTFEITHSSSFSLIDWLCTTTLSPQARYANLVYIYIYIYEGRNEYPRSRSRPIFVNWICDEGLQICFVQLWESHANTIWWHRLLTYWWKGLTDYLRPCCYCCDCRCWMQTQEATRRQVSIDRMLTRGNYA